MSNIANVVGAVIGLAAINRLLDRTDKVAPTVAPTVAPVAPVVKPVKPLIKEGLVTGPAGPSISDFDLLKGAITITPKQLEAYEKEKTKIVTLSKGALARGRKGFGL